MALENKYKITVNTKSRMFREIPEVVANDNVVFEIEVYEGATLFPLLPAYSYKFVSKKNKGNPVIRDASLVGGLVRVELGTSEMTEPGKVEGTLQIYDAEMKRISTAEFSYIVKRDPSMDGELPNDERNLIIANESLLIDAIDKAEQSMSRVDELITKAPQPSEVVDARGGETTLGARLNNLSSSLAQNASKTEGIISVKDPMFGAKGNGVADDTLSIQNAINYVATRGKKLYIPSGIYLISSPLVLPSESSKWGIEISGEKSETKYQYLPGSSSTVIKATSIIQSMITNRGANPNVDVAYYSVIKNLAIDGNNLAAKGYVNGWQDKLIDCSIIQCTDVGVNFGYFTNSTVLNGVTMALNNVGFRADGQDSTVWHLNNCMIRENTGDGAFISSGIGAVLTSCIFESNGGRGILIKGTTDPLTRVNNLTFSNCYFENNDGYEIELDRDGTVSPQNIEFNKTWINAYHAKAVNIQYGDKISFLYPNFVGANPATVGYFINNNGTGIEIKGDETVLSSVNFSITGTNANHVVKDMIKAVGVSKGRVFNNVTKAAVLQPNPIVCTNNKTMLPEELAGTILNNNGQSGTNINIHLPIPVENYRFRFVCSVTQAANNFRINTNGETTIFLDGVENPKAWVEIVNPKMGDCIEFMAFAGDNYYWIAKPIRGTWTTY
jgi:hypothetical protein